MVNRRLVVRFVLTLALAAAMFGPAAAQQADRFFIFGVVKNPGAYAVKTAMTVGDAIDVAGGFLKTSSGIDIVRLIDGKQETLPASLSDQVIANDTILVKK